ncbi:uncharacterized protein BDZ99DRAFT_547570 [Mytilinidion resinicola]|uniref:Uncharacterized protein n=1 Tax=Mytilinidion resinicola TaxID=574789 RepID=A0A6A6Y4V3_9PEZI|nr:uncharacterized protein BDZ99DRAFT_547570 [Mytilinidion resinicola]KAF2803054.1 hypothetical protein BDZ99DRAFT_547570 [Mytilinidion resinicola]
MLPKRKADAIDGDGVTGTRPPELKAPRLPSTTARGVIQAGLASTTTTQSNAKQLPVPRSEASHAIGRGDTNASNQDKHIEGSLPSNSHVNTQLAKASQPVDADQNLNSSESVNVDQNSTELQHLGADGTIQDGAEATVVDITPKYPPLTKTFNNSDEARQWRLSHITTKPYMDPSTDATIAKVASNRDKWVLRLYDAFRDITDVGDLKVTSAAYKNFVQDAAYDTKRIEAVCHEILDEILSLCNDGFQLEKDLDYTIRSRATQVEKKDRSLTCKQRLKKIINVIQEEKQVCFDLMKSPFGSQMMKIFVNAPTACGRAKVSSRTSNLRRSQVTKAANEATGAARTTAPKALRRKNKDYRVESDSKAEENVRETSANKIASRGASGSQNVVQKQAPSSSKDLASRPMFERAVRNGMAVNSRTTAASQQSRQNQDIHGSAMPVAVLDPSPDSRLRSPISASGVPGHTSIPIGNTVPTAPAQSFVQPKHQPTDSTSRPIKAATRKRRNASATTQPHKQGREANAGSSTPLQHKQVYNSPAATQPLQQDLSFGINYTQAPQYNVNSSTETHTGAAARALQQNFRYGGRTVYEDLIQQSQAYAGAAASPLAQQDFSYGVSHTSAHRPGTNNSPYFQVLADAPTTPCNFENDTDGSFQSSFSVNYGQSAVTPAVPHPDCIFQDGAYYTPTSRNSNDYRPPGADVSMAQVDWMALANNDMYQDAMKQSRLGMGKENLNPNKLDDEL